MIRSKLNIGCSGHHFEDRTETGNYRVRAHGGIGWSEWYAEKEVEMGCEHDGCSKKKKEWRPIDDYHTRLEAKHGLAEYLEDETP